ncbi:MAG: hypothetical protein COB36_09925 [Alphaproteobacteria bacterium]|nr:MAG: hypothetical protein COB36_09925 [Alphaproteobacteria bacterium]
MTNIAVDTDAIHKLIVFGLAAEANRVLLSASVRFCALNATKYVLRSKIRKSPPQKDLGLVMADLEAWFDDVEIIEPDEGEISLAAEFESIAQKLGVSLDIGESLLCSILINRSLSLILTGDKRAIVAGEKVFIEAGSVEYFQDRLICLEQVILLILSSGDPEVVRSAICAEPNVDTAISICFSCTSAEITPDSWAEGLKSYITQLEKQAPTVLYPVSF